VELLSHNPGDFAEESRRRHSTRRIFSSVSYVKNAMLWVVGLGAGIAVGLWMASMTYFCTFCLFAPPRFAVWECCVVGLGVSVIGLGTIVAFDREFLPASRGGIRRVSRFLFEDLAQRQTD
jgi:hypothetical protein